MENVTSRRELAARLSMPHQCPFCERVNPSDAKFCNACGAPLHLLPCPECGAVNDAAATACHQCAAPLHGVGQGAPASSPVPQPTRGGGAAVAAAPTADPDALDRDAKVFATLQELRELLAQTEAATARGNPESDAAKAVPLHPDAAPSYPAPAVAVAADPHRLRPR